MASTLSNMVIYNVTTKVDWSIAKDWLEWMQDIHVPEVIGTGCFTKHQLVRLLEIDEEEGPTYAAQYFAFSMVEYDYYQQHFASSLRKTAADKWGDKCIAFRSLMEIVN